MVQTPVSMITSCRHKLTTNNQHYSCDLYAELSCKYFWGNLINAVGLGKYITITIRRAFREAWGFLFRIL
jgi:hypothetical protein